MSEGLLNNTTEGILSNYCPWWPLMVSLKQLASPGTPSAGQQFSQIARCRPLPADALIKAAGGEGTALLVLPLWQMDNNWQSSLRTRQHLDLGLQIRGSLLQVTVEKKSANKNEKKKWSDDESWQTTLSSHESQHLTVWHESWKAVNKALWAAAAVKHNKAAGVNILRSSVNVRVSKTLRHMLSEWSRAPRPMWKRIIPQCLLSKMSQD